MVKILKNPFAWLFLQALIMMGVVSSPVFDLRYSRDSISYLEYFPPFENIHQFFFDVFSNYRTFGYPLFLKIVSAFTPDYQHLPMTQYTVHVAAILVFGMGLRRYGFGRWTALAAVSPLFYSRVILKYCSQPMADSLAASFAVLTLGFLFLIVSQPEKWIYRLGLLSSLFLTYQIRPTYIFLLLLIPILGLVLFFLRTHKNEWVRIVKKTFLLYLSLCLIPFFIFCTFRWGMVRHFGITSYGGINLSTMTTVLLTKEMIPTLSKELQPLATSILEERNARSVANGMVGERVGWKDYMAWLYAVPRYISTGAILSAQSQDGKNAKSNTGGVVRNEKLKKLAMEVIKSRPLVYAQFVFLSIQKSMMEVVNTNMLLQIALGIFILSRIFYGLKFRERISMDGDRGSLLPQTHVNDADIMLFLGSSFFFVKMIMFSLVTSPQGRYYTGAEIFLTSVLTVAAVEPWERRFARHD